MSLRLAIAVCVFASFFGAQADAQLHPNIWTVRSGDALSLLAERFDTSVEQLKTWNSLADDKIQIGQKLVVRGEDDETLRPQIDEVKNVMAEETISAGDATIRVTLEEVDLEPAPSDVIEEVDPPLNVPSIEASATRPLQHYKIVAGDTLSQIATAQNTTLRAIIDANPGINPERIRIGTKIRIGTARPEITYVVERGDTISTIAERYGVSSAELRRWNANIHFAKMRLGTNLRIFTDEDFAESECFGATNKGHLEQGVMLAENKAYMIRSKDRAFGTLETIRWMTDAFEKVSKKYKHRKRVRIHDISDEDGGRLRDHKSHQNGRDVDISYYQKSCKNNLCPFEPVKPRKLDVGRQWTLLSHWLKTGQAEIMFIDYSLQGPLYRHAKRKGATEKELERWFQYPRGKKVPRGKIRHFRKHNDHLHVRFVCPVTDKACR